VHSIVGREEELKEINSKLTETGSLLIHGLGGLGKSTLASYYLFTQKNNYDYYGFFDSLEDFVSALKIALHLQQTSLEDQFREAIIGLKQLEGSKLLIFDDAKNILEDDNKLTNVLSLVEDGFNIIFTSRKQIENINSYDLGTLQTHDAREVFLEYYPTDELEKVNEILSFLDNHTLFIEVVAKTLSFRKNSLSLDTLLKEFETGSFGKIQSKSDESFYHLLDALYEHESLLNNEKIQLFMKRMAIFPAVFIRFDDLEKILGTYTKTDLEFILNDLVISGLLIKNDNSFKLHQIVKNYILDSYTIKFKDVKKSIDYFTQALKRSYDFLYASNVQVEEEQNEEDKKQEEAFQNSIVRNLFLSSEISRQIKANEQIAILMVYQASLYRYFGNYTLAIKLYEYIVKINEHVYKEEHPCTATSYNNLARLYESIGAYEKAEPLYEKALKLIEKLLGEEHPDTASSYNNLALLYKSMGTYKKAEPLHVKALKLREKLLGEEHPHTATSYNDLANLYKSMGAYEKAEPLFEKALKLREKLLGEEHPHTATSYNNLASLYESMGAYEKAEPLYEKALKLREKLLGEEHPHTATSYNNLAVFYYGQGEYKKAYAFMQKAVQVREKVLPAEHPDLVSAKEGLEVILMKMQKESY